MSYDGSFNRNQFYDAYLVHSSYTFYEPLIHIFLMILKVRDLWEYKGQAILQVACNSANFLNAFNFFLVCNN